MLKRLTVKEVAGLLGVSDQFLRVALQQGKFAWGTAVKLSTRWTYYINSVEFEKYREVKG